MLNNKVVVITGGAGLLGQEFSKTVLINNGIAVIADFDEIRGLKITKQLKDLTSSGRADFHALNINDKLSLQNLISYLDKKYGKIDALVNCA